MNDTAFLTAADAFADWRDNVLTGEPPTLWPIGSGELARIEIGPGLVTLLGGAPGAGKTAFAMQAVVDALRLTPALRVLICNIEMPAAVLLDRQLSRLSGIDVSTIRYRRFDASHADRLDQALHTLEGLTDRLCFVRPPFTLGNVAAAADAFRADVLLLDYIQRIAPPGMHGDKRGSVDASMNFIRQFADAGTAVICVAAVSRSKDSKGRSSYDGDGLNLASFRESSELEFGADDAFILTPDANGETVTLRHLKARHSEPKDLTLTFDRRLQRFAPASTPAPAKPNRKLTAAPRLLAGCEVLPAMEPPGSRPTDEPPEVDSRKTTGKAAKRKAAERFAMLNAFVDFTAGTLARGELLVWLVLFRDSRDGIAQTSQADIARRAGMTDRTVRRTLKRLETRGLVQTVFRGGIHRGVSKYRCHPLDRSD